MSWNNAVPWYIYDIEREHREAMFSCAFPEELNAGWVRSVPIHWTWLDIQWKRPEDRPLYSLGVRIG